MRTLISLLVVLAVLAAMAFAGMWALDAYVEPRTREMTVDVPLDSVLGD